jgi:hypothetical protein
MGEQKSGNADGGVRISERTGQPMRKCLRWTAARKEAFLEHLARTCHVSFSATAVGMSPSSLQWVRNHDEAFAERFEGALQAGYQRIEADLLAHVLAQGCTVEEGESGPITVARFDPDLAIKVLQQRGNSVRAKERRNSGTTIKRASEREIEDALLSKLKGLAKRLALIA